jgi:hypothetical protein
MKIYLNSDDSGGLPFQSYTLIGRNHHIKGYPAFIASFHKNVKLSFYYDICGGKSKREGIIISPLPENKRNIEKGEIKEK